MDSTFLGFPIFSQLDQLTLHVFRSLDRVNRGQLSIAFANAFNLFVYHFIIDLDDVIRNFLSFAQFHVHRGRQSNIINKLETFLIQIQLLLFCLARKWLTQDIQIVLLDIIRQTLSDQLVDLLNQNGFTVHFLDNTERSFPFPETINHRFLLVIFQRVAHASCVIILIQLNLNGCIKIVDLVLCYIHTSL